MADYCAERVLLSVDKIKALLGIEPDDTTHDDMIAVASPIVTEYFENYCGRGLAYEADISEDHYMINRVRLNRYPIQTLQGATVNGADYPVINSNFPRGWVYFYGCPWSTDLVTVTYSGGYEVDCCPPDLADAYAKCVADFGKIPYSTTDSTGSGTPLKSLSLGTGALAVSFETAGGSTTITYDVADAPTLLQPFVYTLRRYRPEDFV